MNTPATAHGKVSHPLIDQKEIKKSISLVLKNWYWFVLFIGAGISLSVLFLYRATEFYGSSSTILLKTQEQMLEGFAGDKIPGDKHKPDISNEMLILTSRSMVNQALSHLKIDVSYFIQGRIRTGEVYKETPFSVDGKITDPGLYGTPFNIQILDKDQCKVWIGNEKKLYEKVIRFGQPYVTNKFSFVINGNIPAIASNPGLKNVNYQFVFNNRENLINDFQNSLRVEKVQDASAIKITIENPVVEKATDFLDTLTNLYIENAISVNKQINENTLAYLDNEINYIEQMLSSSESQLVTFQSGHNIIDPKAQQSDFAKRTADLENEKTRLKLTLDNINSLYNYLTDEENVQNISPAALNGMDPTLVAQFGELSSLMQQRNNMLFSNTPSSPAVKEIDGRIAQLRNIIIGTVLSIRISLAGQITNLSQSVSQYKGELSTMPNINRGLATLERSKDVNEKIYLFLLETRAQTMIARAGIVSDKSILEPARSIGLIRPIRAKILATGFGAGLALAILLIFIKGMYRNFIQTKEDLKEITNLPIIGLVVKSKEAEKEYLIVEKFPQSATSEAFRVIRTNLSYYNPKAQSKVVLFTSTMAGEGKTFCTLNTGTILAKSKKKVVILDLDLHKPKQANALNLQNDVGITSYIVGKNTLDEVIKSTGVAGLDIILSGPRTPNASELVLDPNLEALINELKNRYEYVLLDTPPVGLLSDALEFMRFADVSLYVLKANYSKKDFVEVAHQIVDKNAVKHLGFILNSVSAKNITAGYGGGYYK